MKNKLFIILLAICIVFNCGCTIVNGNKTFTEEDISQIKDIEEFEALIISAFKNGDHELLNLLIGEDRYKSLEADPEIEVASYQGIKVAIGSSGYLYTQALVGSNIHFNDLGYSHAIAYYVEEDNDRFYLKAFGTFHESDFFLQLDVDNYVAFPELKDIPYYIDYTIDLEDFHNCRDKDKIAEVVKLAILNRKWNTLAQVGGGYVEPYPQFEGLIPQFKLEKEIANLEYVFRDSIGYTYFVKYTDETTEAFSVGIYEEQEQTKIIILY